MEAATTKQHAHPNTVFRCFYGYYNLGYSRQELADVYNNTVRTTGNWMKVRRHRDISAIQDVVRQEVYSRPEAVAVRLLPDKPLAYLDEAQAAFTQPHRVAISKASIWRIIHDFGFTWKVLELRAMHVKEHAVFRFVEELGWVNWSHQNQVFLDEVTFDNRGMIQKRVYAMRGEKVAIRGDFQRKPEFQS